MKMIKYICAFFIVAIIGACTKTMDVSSPEFNASVAQETIKVGEEVTFQLSGSANVITFYSGETGADYQYREGRPLELSDPQVSFSSNANYGKQENQLSILVSTKFNGDYTSQGITASLAANEWENLTNKFILSSRKATSGAYNGETLASGTFNLSDLVGPEKKGVYFAYRNVVQKESVGGTFTQWTMSKFVLSVNTLNGRQTIADQKSADWKIIAQGGNDYGKEPEITATSVFFKRNTTKEVDIDNWAITKKIEFESVDLGPDYGEPIKSYADPQLTEYKHTYTKTGTYEVTFVASNINAQGEKKIVKKMTIVVE